jgi:UDP-4-amino-4,6-dideoxy-N-acetyl-beta-L-altrosamine transaminase
MVTQGPSIDAFENAFAARHQVAHAVAMSSATAGLHIACLALGVTTGSRVWTCPNSFVASANCALYCGGSVDFVDIDSSTRNMSLPALAEKLKKARRENKLPHVLIPVDFSGLPCELREMRALADQYDFKIIEDASHATGATYLGKPVGSQFADATVFSFHAVKIVTTAEGGIVTTQNDDLALRLRTLRSHGTTRDPRQTQHAFEGPWYYEQQSLGYNYRMTDVHAALGLSQLGRVDAMHVRREALAARYDDLLKGAPLLLPPRLPDRRSAWHLYVVEVDGARTPRSRAEVFEQMRGAQIGVNVHYIPIHTHPYYVARGFRPGDFPASELYYSRALSIPLFPALTEDQQNRVAATLRSAVT